LCLANFANETLNNNPIDDASESGSGAHDAVTNVVSSAERGGGVTPLLVAPFFAVAAWIIPGLGHLALGRRGRALIFFLAVGGLAITGYLLRGTVFPPRSGDLFGTLGFFADASTGMFYVLARFFESAGSDVSRAAGDYGTRFIAAAGIVNLLSMFDAYEIALGRRTM
jgi:hypothetical protein